MQPPRIPDDESQRLDALRACAVLDTPPEARFDRLTRLAARLFDVPIALVSLIDAERQWFKSRVGLDATQTGRDISFCGHAILSPEILEIPDALLDARFADNPLVTGAPGIRFYAGAPLRVGGDHLVGTLCLIDTRPRQLDDAQRQSLRDLADCVQDELLRVHEIELRQQLERQMMFAETISLAQNSFIRETDRSRSFDSLLEAILGLTQSAFGFIGEVLGADEQAPYLKVHAISQLGIPLHVRSYEERSLGKGEDARACAFVEVAQNGGDRECYGIGIDANIVTASLRALVSGVNCLASL